MTHFGAHQAVIDDQEAAPPWSDYAQQGSMDGPDKACGLACGDGVLVAPEMHDSINGIAPAAMDNFIALRVIPFETTSL